MLYTRSILAVLAVTVSTFAAAQPNKSAQGAANAQSSDIAAIRAISGKWKELYAAGRYSEIAELYTQDALVMPRGRPRVEGREGMRKAVGGLAAGRRVDIELTEREIVVSGNFAWVVSDFKVSYMLPNSVTPPTAELGRGLVVFRKDKDGQWRIHRDIDSPAPPASALASTEAPANVAAAPSRRPFPAMWNPASRTEVTACDRMTSSHYDRTRLAPWLDRQAIDVPAAIQQCEADLLLFPGDPRINFQLGRIYGYTADRQKALAYREAAAAGGNHNAIFLLGYLDWVAAKDDVVRCTAERTMKLSADRGNYSAQITYAIFFNEGRFSMCKDRASNEEVVAYVEAAKPVVDGFFETRIVEHLIWESKGKN